MKYKQKQTSDNNVVCTVSESTYNLKIDNATAAITKMSVVKTMNTRLLILTAKNKICITNEINFIVLYNKKMY